MRLLYFSKPSIMLAVDDALDIQRVSYVERTTKLPSILERLHEIQAVTHGPSWIERDIYFANPLALWHLLWTVLDHETRSGRAIMSQFSKLVTGSTHDALKVALRIHAEQEGQAPGECRFFCHDAIRLNPKMWAEIQKLGRQ